MIITPGPSRRRRAASRLPWMVMLLGLVMLAVMLGDIWLPIGDEFGWAARFGVQSARVAEQVAQAWQGRLSPGLLALVSAVFVHASWLHLAGNLAYLWVFGIPVERVLGPWFLLLAFVLLSGLANLVMALVLRGEESLIIGASGGVSAIIGVYLGLFPSRRIGLWLPLGLFLQFARIPALLVIGSWFTLQLVYTMVGPMSDTVAWQAHLAGFAAGLLVALPIRLLSGRMPSLREHG
ncbi:MAG: rhomboid family intramembrane serine protease [Wenzhouxiangellaceae bacterium]|nr:rhomboid family intramembrane serine protease [Wenzhouxiangellaceae bacterium]